MTTRRKFVSYYLIVWKADCANPNYADIDVSLQEEGRGVLELELEFLSPVMIYGASPSFIQSSAM
jgi:hypothetical protein